MALPRTSKRSMTLTLAHERIMILNNEKRSSYMLSPRGRRKANTDHKALYPVHTTKEERFFFVFLLSYISVFYFTLCIRIGFSNFMYKGQVLGSSICLRLYWKFMKVLTLEERKSPIIGCSTRSVDPGLRHERQGNTHITLESITIKQ